eukprot:1161049-Pelagomonas_calceolata.AAC.10
MGIARIWKAQTHALCIRMSDAELYEDLLRQRGMAGVASPQMDAQWARILGALKALVQGGVGAVYRQRRPLYATWSSRVQNVP